MYQGKSINTPSFLLAVLKNEGLVQPSTTKRRCHEWVDEARFVAEMQAWAASGKEAKVEDAPGKGRGKLAKGPAKVQLAEVKPDEPSKVETISKALPFEGKSDSAPKTEASERPKVVPKNKVK